MAKIITSNKLDKIYKNFGKRVELFMVLAGGNIFKSENPEKDSMLREAINRASNEHGIMFNPYEIAPEKLCLVRSCIDIVFNQGKTAKKRDIISKLPIIKEITEKKKIKFKKQQQKKLNSIVIFFVNDNNQKPEQGKETCHYR